MSAFSETQQMILRATECGDARLLDELLSAAPDALRSWPELVASPLHEAAEHGDEQICQKLIDAGAPVDAIDETLQTPLFVAVRSLQEEAAKVLLNAGASTSHKDIEGCTPLHECARNNAGSIAVMLISKGAEIDVRNNDEETALHIAAKQASPALCALLISAGADSNSTARGWMTPLWSAAKDGRTAVCKTLVLSGASMSGTEESPSAFLQSCAVEDASKSAELMSAFIEQGADVNELDRYGIAKARRLTLPGAAHICALNDNAPGLEVLAQAGMQLQNQICDGMNPLHLSALVNAVEAASKLIELGLVPDKECQAIAESSGHRDVLALFHAYEAQASIRKIALGRVPSPP